MFGKWRPKKVLIPYSDGTELLTSPIRTSTDTAACDVFTSTAPAAAGEGF